MVRLVHEFTLPVSMKWDGGPAKVGMRQLTAGEEIQVSRVGGFDLMKTQHEATKRSIVEIDGKKVDWGKGEVDELWEACGPKVRTLLISAFNRISGATEEESNGFFDSMETRAVG